MSIRIFQCLEGSSLHSINSKDFIRGVSAKHRLMKYKILLAVLASASMGFSQDSTASWASAGLVPDSLSVGDSVQLLLKLAVPHGVKAELASEHPDLGSFSVLSATQKRVDGSVADTLLWKLWVTTYDPTRDTIPAVSFLIHVNDSICDTVSSQSLVARIIPTISAKLPPDSIKLREIKPPVSAGKYPWYWWLLVPLLCGLIFIILKFFKGRKKVLPEYVAPPKPAYDEAIEALDLLDKSELLLTGRTREYVFALSDIAKRYIERRFEVAAQEWTTDELLEWIVRSPMSSEIMAATEKFFRDSHPVKFAKLIPLAVEARAMREDIGGIVDRTKPVIAETKPVASVNQAEVGK